MCKPILKSYLDFLPALVAEVLSPTTALMDKNSKRRYYQQAGVRYFLLIDPRAESIQVLELIEGEYREVESPQTYELENGCLVKPDFSRLFS